jgi:hypothetical protein
VRTKVSGGRRIRTGLAAGAALLALTGTVAGCSSDDDGGDEPIEGAETETPGADDTEDGGGAGEGADVAALEQLYADYWDAMVELESSEDLDPQLLDGIATSRVLESELSRINTYKSHGFHRQGEPTIENVTVEVTGDTARIEACKNEGEWPFVTADGEEVTDPAFADLDETKPNVLEAERSSDGWLVSGSLPMREATISCSE